FLIGQGYEYFHFVQTGTTIPGSVYGSVFFITTGFHAAHVLAGVIAFLVVLLRTFKSKFTPAQATAAVVVSYYWHFVDVVWIGLWITIYFVQYAVRANSGWPTAHRNSIDELKGNKMDTSNNNASAGAATGAQRSPGAARRRRK